MVTVVQPDPHREVVVENVFIVYTAAEARAVVGDVTAGVYGEGQEGRGQILGTCYNYPQTQVINT